MVNLFKKEDEEKAAHGFNNNINNRRRRQKIRPSYCNSMMKKHDYCLTLLMVVVLLSTIHVVSAFHQPVNPVLVPSTSSTRQQQSFIPSFSSRRTSSIKLYQSTKSKTASSSSDLSSEESSEGTTIINNGLSYVEFAQQNPFLNNLMIATTKTAAADLLAQTVIGGTPLGEIDLQRSLLFCLFGCVYLGGFQYLYQVQIFKKLFDVDKFTQQTLEEKLQDREGLQALGAQTALDLTVLTLIYLPTFYIFKASVFSGSLDPSVWFDTGVLNFKDNFTKDEFDLIRVWLPADLVCFSVPLYLRLPVRHVVSFVWTAYLSFARGGH